MGIDYLKGTKPKLTLAFFLSFVGVVMSMLPYVIVAILLNSLLSGQTSINQMTRYVVLILCAYIASVLLKMLSTVVSHDVAFSVLETIRLELVSKIDRLSLGRVRERSFGSWSMFVGETMDKLEKPIAHLIPEVSTNILATLLMIVAVFVLDVRLGIANLLTIPVGIVFYMAMMKDYEKQSKRHIAASKKVNSTITEYVNGIEVIKAFNRGASSYQKFEEDMREDRDSNMDWFKATGRSMSVVMELIPSTLLFVLPVGLYLFFNEMIASSTLLICIILAISTMRPLMDVMEYMATIADLNVTFKETNSVMNMEEMTRPDKEVNINNFGVEFKDVHFSYEQDEVIKGTSLYCEEGKLTAIVGPSGGGKSTLASLLVGFYPVSDGKISIGGVNINNIPLKQNMDLVTYVTQDNFLFDESIMYNIKMGRSNATDDEVVEVCKKIGVHEFIESLSDGYNTKVGDAGGHLSGGERQRITIARAIIKDSPIVLMDEATAYIDPDNEAKIQTAIDVLLKNKTVIMIAHRLSTIVNADQIYVIGDGKCEGYGTHEELLSSCSLYKQMWKSHKASSSVDGEEETDV